MGRNSKKRAERRNTPKYSYLVGELARELYRLLGRGALVAESGYPPFWCPTGTADPGSPLQCLTDTYNPEVEFLMVDPANPTEHGPYLIQGTTLAVTSEFASLEQAVLAIAVSNSRLAAEAAMRHPATENQQVDTWIRAHLPQ